MATPARARAAGFTLIELLVTLVVIGIAIGLVLLSPGVVRDTPATESALTDLAAQVALARDEAALQGRNLGVRFYPDGYEFLDLDPDTGAWTTLSGDEILARTVFDEDLLPYLRVEDRRIELEPPVEAEDDEEELIDAFGNVIERAGAVPHVLILASGEVTPFEIELEMIGSDDYMRLEADFFGDMTLERERDR
jgi:general secretion pathway protein H